MARHLKDSPLPRRVTEPRPRRDWLWSDEGAYDGLIVLNAARDASALLPHLGQCKALVSVDGALCLLFRHSVVLNPDGLGAALPLRSVGANRFTSFDLTGDAVAAGVHIIDQGSRRTIDLSHAVHVDPLSLWDLTSLVVVRSKPLPQPERPATTPPKVTGPRKNTKLAEVTDLEPIYGDVRDALEQAPEKTLRERAGDVERVATRTVMAVVGVLALLLLIIVGLMFSVSVLGAGAAIGPFGLIAAIVFLFWFFSMFLGGKRSVGPAGQRQGQAQGQAKAHAHVTPRYRGPGLFDRLKSWALWNSRLGDRLRSEIEKQINDVSKMIERGEIDRALKRALAIGEKREKEEKRKSAPLTAPPKPRGNLDLDYSGRDKPSSAVLTDAGFGSMRQQYIDLARKLSADGDHKRAAFIYSELLGDVHNALAELEAMKAYEDAAKLATARKMPGHMAARLWFLAGRKEIALALAKRHDAFEQIANAAADKDPEFAAFVRGCWIEQLIAAGDLRRAVVESARGDRLDKLHQSVLQQAVLAGLLDKPDVLIAAVVGLKWDVAVLSSGARQTGMGAVGVLEKALQKLIQGTTADDTEQRQALFSEMTRLRAQKQARMLGFWDDHAPALADALVRTVLANDAGQPSAPDIAALRQFAKDMSLPVLAEDLRHIIRRTPQAPKTSNTIQLPRMATETARWSMIACASNGCTVVAGSDGELTLLDASGNRMWTDYMTDLVDICPIGPGRQMLLIQGTGLERKITVLDTRLHSYRMLGRVELVSWDKSASVHEWLVQSADAVGGLDIAALIDADPQIEWVWSISQTVPVAVLAFQSDGATRRWVSQRMDEQGPGLMEIWTLTKSTQDLSVFFVEPGDEKTRAVYQAPHLFTASGLFTPAENDAHVAPFWPLRTAYSFNVEQEITRKHGRFLSSLLAFAKATAAGRTRAVYLEDTTAHNITLSTRDGVNLATLRSCKVIKQAATEDGNRLALIDSTGRVLLCNFKRLDAFVVMI